jgi:GlpG protein
MKGHQVSDQWRVALSVPVSQDLSGFLQRLEMLGIPARATESGGHVHVLTVPAFVPVVQGIWAEWGNAVPATGQAQGRAQGRGQDAHRVPVAPQQVRLAEVPVTALVLGACIMVAVLTRLGDPVSRWMPELTFTAYALEGPWTWFASWRTSLVEPWRFFTPALLHFSISHLVFNLLTFWIFAPHLEKTLGPVRWGLALLFMAVFSNAAQHVASEGTVLFGGLSGVVYGCVGMAMVFRKHFAAWARLVPPGLYVMMLVMLALGFTGLLGTILGVQIANTAHLCGLLAGIMTGALFVKSGGCRG